MPPQIYKFPERRTYYRGYKIPLYTEEQIFLTVISLNIFGNLTEKVTEKTLEEYEPLTVIKALVEAKSSSVFSSKAKNTIQEILKSIETL